MVSLVGEEINVEGIYERYKAVVDFIRRKGGVISRFFESPMNYVHFVSFIFISKRDKLLF